MNRNAWSDEDRAEYDALCDEAWRFSDSSGQRVERYVQLLRDGDQAHRYFAADCLDDAVHRGAAAQLKAWRASQSKGRIPVSYQGKVLSTRRVIGAVLIGDDGTPMHTQTIFDFLTWEQLEEKAREYVTNIRAFRKNLHTITRLLELRDLVPSASTPGEAVESLGTTIEQFLSEEKPAA